MHNDEQTFWTEPCFYCEKPAGPGVLQHADTYALVCPQCRRFNRIRVNVAEVSSLLAIAVVGFEIKAWNASVDALDARVFDLLPTATVRFWIPLLALLSIIGATIWGAVKLAHAIKGNQPRMPGWSESDYQDSNVVSGTITPPFRDEPARISLVILKTEGQIRRAREKTNAEP
jgi:hypothetical protein